MQVSVDHVCDQRGRRSADREGTATKLSELSGDYVLDTARQRPCLVAPTKFADQLAALMRAVLVAAATGRGQDGAH